jgi:hypothetical protein
MLPKEYKRSGATINRYMATFSHLFSFAVKERRLLDRDPVYEISRKKEPRARTRFLSDQERAALLNACLKSVRRRCMRSAGHHASASKRGSTSPTTGFCTTVRGCASDGGRTKEARWGMIPAAKPENVECSP